MISTLVENVMFWAELLYLDKFTFQHALPLPGFIFLATDIYNHAIMFNKTGNVFMPGLSIEPSIFLVETRGLLKYMDLSLGPFLFLFRI